MEYRGFRAEKLEEKYVRTLRRLYISGKLHRLAEKLGFTYFGDRFDDVLVFRDNYSEVYGSIIQIQRMKEKIDRHFSDGYMGERET